MTPEIDETLKPDHAPRRFGAMTPLARSLAHLRADGWTCCIVERWNVYACVRQDAFGFGDILAVKGLSIVLVQVTSASNVSARKKKIEALPDARTWLMAGGLVAVHGWSLRGMRGKRKTWQLRNVNAKLLIDGKISWCEDGCMDRKPSPR